MTNGGDGRQGAWSVRRGRRRFGHATIAMLGRGLVSTVIVLGGLSAAAILGPLLDRRGLPGGLFAAAILLVLVAISLRIVLGDLPPRGRRRMLGREAKRRGLKLRIRPRVPRSLRSSPSFSDERTRGADVWHLIAFPGDPPVLTFDRRVERQDPHATPTWWASAACMIPFESPRLIVEPRPTVTADPLGPLLVRSSESEAFGRRFRIRTEDELFATGFLDQRMLAWMLERDEGWTFEVGGRWAMVSHRDLRDPGRLDRSVEVLRLFCSRMPRVVASLFPVESS
jgi:hypothetical protein